MQKETLSFSLETEKAKFSLFPNTNVWELTDKRAHVTWGNADSQEAWVAWACKSGDVVQHIALTLRSVETLEDPIAGKALSCRFIINAQDNDAHIGEMDAAGADAGFSLVFRLRTHILQVYFVPDPACNHTCDTLAVFNAGLEANAVDNGELLLPIRMGLLLQAHEGEPFSMRLGTYDYEQGVHMAMAGLFKSSAALMATWGDPYIKLNVSRETLRVSKNPKGFLRMSFELSKTARSLELHCLGPGDLHAVAAAYRERAQELGYRVTWEEKLKEHPLAARLFGASNVKLWHALARRIDEDMVEQSVEVNWTFDEAAQIAEHLKRDLKMDDVLFHLGGWTRYGYDCKHPDNMPANPECGGNAGLADCVRRVQNCDYLFCLHDNYQDMYRDAPSWDEKWLQKESDGSPHMGGVWLGGQAYYTCAHEALKLAQRPENLPLIQAELAPDLYFIDTTYAVGPQECFDPRHPLTKQEDIYWKKKLSDYARDLFGLFGSECGREWAVPHADFFEGLASVRGDYYHRLEPYKLGGRIVPLFDMVFRDCITIHGKYGYNPMHMGEQVIHHVAIGRTLYYHALGEHLYWRDPATHAEIPYPKTPTDPAVFTRAHNGWAEGMCLWDRFMKNTHEVLSPLNKRTSQTLIKWYDFLDEARLIRKTLFGNGVTAVVNGSTEDYVVQSQRWGEVALPPYGFLIDAEDFVAFHAHTWNGHIYTYPVLFTLTSLNDKPLESSRRVRAFHGFGESALAWHNAVVDVKREAVI